MLTRSVVCHSLEGRGLACKYGPTSQNEVADSTTRSGFKFSQLEMSKKVMPEHLADLTCVFRGRIIAHHSCFPICAK